MIVGVLKEPSFESRVSLLAETAAALVKKGVVVWVEAGAGTAASCSDEEYSKTGSLIKQRSDILKDADIILSIHPPSLSPAPAVTAEKQKIFIGIYQPLYNADLMYQWASAQATVFSMDMLPRTTRAQSMDVLSSQANIAGYKAVLVAANLFPRY